MLAKFCVSPTTEYPLRLTSKQMESSPKAFKKTSVAELIEVRALLYLIVAELEKIELPVDADARTKESGRT